MGHKMTRVHFCPSCRKHERPKESDYFALWGGTTEDFYILQPQYKLYAREYGYTPHLVELVKSKKVNGKMCCEYTARCLVHGCGIFIEVANDGDPDNPTVTVYEMGRAHRYIVPLKEWNALVTFKDTGYELCEPLKHKKK